MVWDVTVSGRMGRENRSAIVSSMGTRVVPSAGIEAASSGWGVVGSGGTVSGANIAVSKS
jgi:hypothetical protein